MSPTRHCSRSARTSTLWTRGTLRIVQAIAGSEVGRHTPLGADPSGGIAREGCGLFADPRTRDSKALVAYFGLFQTGHFLLNARYQLVPFDLRPPLPFAPPPGGWAPQMVYFTSGMAVADLINAAFSVVFVVGFFQRAKWSPWLGTVTLTVATYAALAFTWGMVAAGAPALGVEYAWLNIPTIPVLVLFIAWSRWVINGRVP